MTSNRMMDENYKLSAEEILLLKLIKCLYLFGGNVLYNVTRDIVYNHPLSQKGNNSDFPLLFSKLKQQSNDLKHIEIRDNFDFSFSKKNEDIYHDVSELFMVIQVFEIKNELFDDNIGESLKNNFTTIKSIRNSLFHERTYSTNEIIAFKEELVNSVKNICDLMNQAFINLNYDNFDRGEKCTYKYLCTKILDHVDTLWEKKVDYSDKRESEGMLEKDVIGNDIKKWRSALNLIYEKLFTIPAFLQDKDFQFHVKDVFVSRDLIVDQEDMKYTDILERKKDGSSFFILHADPGCGKTTLCKKFIFDWSNSEGYLQEYDILLVIDVKMTKSIGLPQYLKEVLDLIKDSSEDDIIYFLRQLKIFVVIDGFNEKSKEASSLIEDVKKILKRQNIFFTTTPSYLKDLQVLLPDSRIGTFQNLNKDGSKFYNDYIKIIWNILKKTNVKCGDINLFKADFETVAKDLKTNLPLINILIYLWIKDRKTFLELVPSTKLHKHIIDLQRNYLEKAGVSDVFDKIIYSLAKVYFEKECKKPVLIDHVIITIKKELIKNENLNYLEQFLSSMFLSIPTIRNKDDKKEFAGEYEFLYKSQIDFIVARYIVSYMSLKDVSQFNNGVSDRNLELFTFIIGLLDLDVNKQKSENNFIKQMLKNYITNDYNKLSKILFETKDESPLRNLIISHITKINSIWKLNNDNVVSGLNLCSVGQVKKIKISIDSSCEPNLLLPALKNIKIDKENKINIELYLKKHEQNSSSENSESILEYFETWANITKFSGYLALNGIKCLSKFKSLTYIRVRVTSLNELKSLNKSCFQELPLERIDLIFLRPFKKECEKTPQILNLTANISVEFNSIKENEKSLNQAVIMLEKLKPKSKRFVSVIINSNADYDLIKTFVDRVKKKDLIQGNMKIKTNKPLQEHFMKLNMDVNSTFKVDIDN